MIWDNGIETCKISCMKRVAGPGSMHNTGCLGLVHWDNPEGSCKDVLAVLQPQSSECLPRQAVRQGQALSTGSVYVSKPNKIK